MDLGPHLKRLRAARSLTLKQAAAGARLTPSLVSQVENGRTLPSIPSLERLLAFYRVSLVDFFSQVARRSSLVCRAAEVETIAPAAGVRVSLHASKLHETSLVSARVELDPGCALPLHRLDPAVNGERFVLSESGDLELALDGERHLLRPGDSANFKASVAAALAAAPGGAVRAFVTGMPPLFLSAVPGRDTKEGAR